MTKSECRSPAAQFQILVAPTRLRRTPKSDPAIPSGPTEPATEPGGQKTPTADLFKPPPASILPTSQRRAQVAELADALGSGPSGILFPVEVQVLSWALCNRNKLEPFGIHWNFEGFFLLTLPSAPHFQRVPWLTGNGSASTNTLSMAACHSKCSSSRSSRPAVQWLSATRRVKNKARLQQRIDRILEDA